VVATNANALGDYLRARREQIRPDDVGLVPGSRRRVPGLRREEVATLAGISSAYYLRLEQGHDTCPSAQVVEALAQALRLDDKGTEYQHRLATSTGSRSPGSTVQTVTQRLRHLIDQMPFPALVCNRYLDVLAANPCARAMTPGPTPVRNRMCSVFLDPAAREMYVNWDELTDIAVCEFGEAAGDLDDPRFRALFDELSAGSQRFRELWARADVGYSTGIVHMRHPEVGDLHLHRTRLDVPHSGGQLLLMYHAEPGSESAKGLEALRSQGSRLSSTDRRRDPSEP
jgi:transcriptional regulator with XRE-family HTH domain